MGAPATRAVETVAPVGSTEWVEQHTLSCIATNRLGQLHAGRLDDRIFSLEGDLGDFYGFPFRDEFPQRFIDVGIAEASLIGMAAGLALAGKVSMVNTFAAFALMRACEQVRLDVCYHNLEVKIFGSFTGFQSPWSGSTHHALEDLSIARALPHMTVLVPADAVATYHATLLACRTPGPVFVRLGMDVTPQVYGEGARFEVGKANLLRAGNDLTLVAAGLSVVAEAVKAAELLARDGISARVIDLFSIKPIDRQALVSAARETGLVITVEEHNVLGGVGGAVAEVLAEEYPVPMRILGVPDCFVENLDTHANQLERFGLSAERIAASAREAWVATRADATVVGGASR